MGGGHEPQEGDGHQQQQQPSPSKSKAANANSDEPPLNTAGRHNRHRPYQTGCFGCLSRVPGASITSWLIVFVGCGCYVGGNLVWQKMTTDFIVGGVCPIFPWFVIGAAGVTLLLATKFVIVNHYASGETSRHVLLTPGRNCCLRCCDGFFLTLAYVFQLIWILLFTAQIIPLLLLLVTTVCREPTLRTCIDLRHYGMRAGPGLIAPLLASSDGNSNLVSTLFNTNNKAINEDYVRLPATNTTQNSTISYQILGPYRKSAHMCGRDLANFTERSNAFLIAISFAVIGALFVIIGLLNFIICLAGNYKHVKEIRHLPYMVTLDDEFYDEHNNKKSGSPRHQVAPGTSYEEHSRMLQHEGS